MLQRIAGTAGALPGLMTADAGYWSKDNAELCADRGLNAYIATGRLPHGQPLPPKRGPMPKDADAKSRMARKLRSKAGSAIYTQRKAIVEPVNGQIKEARGLRRFLLRGLEKVDAEWHLIAATHNLLKLFRYGRSQQQVLAWGGGCRAWWQQSGLNHPPVGTESGTSSGIRSTDRRHSTCQPGRGSIRDKLLVCRPRDLRAKSLELLQD